MKNYLAAIALTAVTLFSANAQAAPVTATFDDAVSLDNYLGLNFDNFLVVDPEGISDGGFATGRISGNIAINSYGLPAAITSPSTFLAQSLYITAAWRNGLTVDLKGLLGGSEVYSTSVVTDTLGPTFLTLNWAVDSITFVSHGGMDAGYEGEGTHFVLENFTFDTAVSAVPEVNTYLMLLAGIGLMGWVGARRRR